MIKKFLIAISLILLLISCTKDNNSSDISLNRKWQLYAFVVLKIDDMQEQNACSYTTKVSDLYSKPIETSCNIDDVYDFTNPDTLSINFGNKRCSLSDPSILAKYYQRHGDSIITDDFKYHIVLLSRDTLILDYCTDNTVYPPNVTVINRGKIGIKFIRIK